MTRFRAIISAVALAVLALVTLSDIGNAACGSGQKQCGDGCVPTNAVCCTHTATDRDGTKGIYLYDPSGNAVELISYPPGQKVYAQKKASE